HSLARGAADVVSLAHRILEAAVDRPRAIELSVGVRRRSDLLQLAREAIHLIGPLTTRLAREVLLSADTNEALVDVEPALARHSIVAALLSAIGNTPARAKIELKLETITSRFRLRSSVLRRVR
ncbi:MAG TPA: hypothetical protein PK402_02905, partial [Tepidisphaeraceae bacterium]|nr:hypothetical protein [Tepidisphaeraceae bacterium]